MTNAIGTSSEIIQTRTYKAPKELLRRMWSNPEHLTHWWGPIGFTTTTHEMDFKTGGIWRFTMHGPDGRDFPNLVRYTLISPDRIEYSHGGENELVDFVVKVSFVEKGDETEMNFRMIFPSPEEKRRVVEEYGADNGLAMTMGRLNDYASEQNPEQIELVIVRRFSAPQEVVWKALTEVDQIKQWMCPIGVTMEITGGELRPGGKWSTTMTTPSGDKMDAEVEYLEIKPTTLLKFGHRWKKADGSTKPTTLVTMTLSEHQGKTTLVFVQSGFWSEEARAAHLGGWSSTIHKLNVLLGSSKAHRTLTLTREFKAPIDLVWKCWTEPDRLSTWFAPRPFTVPRCEIDLRPGGAFSLVMRSPDGSEHPMHCEIIDVEPRRSFGWINTVPGFDGEVGILGGTMVRFEDLGGSTRVTVDTYASAQSEMGTFMVGGMEMGWNMTLDQLVEVAIAG